MSKLSDLSNKAQEWAGLGSGYPYNDKNLSSKQVPYADRAKNAFAKTNLFYSNSLFLQTQDPTVFGFKLLFEFDQPTSGLLYGVSDAAFDNCANDSMESKNTALAFLLRKKDYQRAGYLRKFLKLLSGINNQTPWFFQEIGGLKDAWLRDYNVPLLKEDIALEVKCLESVDLRITALMDLYRKACFDWKYRREVVPVNLRQFRLSVYVYEARIFHNPNDISLIDPPIPEAAYGYGGNLAGEFSKKNASSTAALLGEDETINDPNTFDVNIVEGVRMSGNRNLFHFDFCEFQFNEPGHLDTINNSEPTLVGQSFKIGYRDVEEENLYTWWSQLESKNINPAVCDSFIASLDAASMDIIEDAVPGVPATNPPTIPAPAGDADLLSKAKELAQKKADALIAKAEIIKQTFDPKALLDRAQDQLLAEGVNAVGSRLSGAFLGNIYGISPAGLLSPSTVGKLTSPTALLDAGASLLNSVNNTNGSSVGDNVNADSTSLTNTTGNPTSEGEHHHQEYTESAPNPGQVEGPSLNNVTGTPSQDGDQQQPSQANNTKQI